MSAASIAEPCSMAPLGFLGRVARRAVFMRLARLRRGRIVVNDAEGVFSCGERSGLQASLRVHHARFFRRVASGGSLAAAEAYIRGDWDCDDLTSLFRIFLQNREIAEHVDGGLSRLARWGHRLLHGRRGNSRRGSRRNIAEHYDLGNDFFQLWLDETMAYSCGIFPTPETSLREASVEKFDRVCRKLDLLPCDEVLEIGAGWGGFAIHAAQRYGCRVATTTISRQQFEAARQRIETKRARGSDLVARARLPRPDRAVRQVGFHRDDRSGRTAVSGSFFPPVRQPAAAWRIDGVAGDRDAGVAFRARSALGRFHSAIRVPRRLPAVAVGDFRRRRPLVRPALRTCGRFRAALRRHVPPLAAELYEPRSATCVALATARNSSGFGIFTCAIARRLLRNGRSACCRFNWTSPPAAATRYTSAAAPPNEADVIAPLLFAELP